ncbi:DNA topoisomerase IB [Ferrovibrio terrae]|uniref:DNA topoisomerase IB n=1 Tax=Ferrovibrio terrae TaxID=2594003 RepID=A0A516GZQ2_9PROT|nr:DNA topoisomerase IB [Ferrovibrio terrae]QDO96993.1 DNA topoisomerase IB [Ferrovibrio terrae]
MLQPLSPEAAAREAGLRYVTDAAPGIRRQRSGTGFSYRLPDGSLVRDAATLKRLRSLAIPPAWTAVWICPREDGHIQATGRDARDRKQYIYHPEFRALRESGKYAALPGFARLLPAIRAQVATDMALNGLPREKVLAAIVYLLERTLIRIGNADYAEQNGSRGLTTLTRRHVKVEGGALRFRFTGKSGKSWDLQLHDRRVLKVIRACQDLPGQELFRYRTEDGAVLAVSSADVNEYLRTVSGSEVTAKDFRTWAGTVMAALALQAFAAPQSQREAKRNLKAAITEVSGKLGNTVTICRKCYIHPVVIERYMAGEHRLRMPTKADITGLQPEEIAVLRHIMRKPRPGPRSEPRASVAAKPGRKTIAKKILRERSETVMASGTQP